MIFITGAARSGTSMTTAILQGHGLKLGARGDINGLSENLLVRQEVLKPYLVSLGADRLGQNPLPPMGPLPPFPDKTRIRIEKMIGAPEPWGYKDAKLTLVWIAWAQMFPEAKWVICRRDGRKIAESCLRTSFMSAFDTLPAWEDWVDAHVARFDEMKRELRYIEVWPDEVVADPSAFGPIAEFCGFEFDAATVGAVVDPAQWH